MSGIITPPPSKSIMQRACAAALLHKGTTRIMNPGTSKDDIAALNIIRHLGAVITSLPDNQIEIESNGISPLHNTIHCNESGLSARLFVPIAALCAKEITITGEGSLLGRPMTEYMKILPSLGVKISAENNCLPVKVHGPLQPADITIDGSVSSQFLSGLLFVYAFSATQPVTIHVTDLKSKPYIDLTLKKLRHFGLHVTNQDYKAFTIQPTQRAENTKYVIDVEADWSAAANFIVANAMGAELSFRQINIDSVQADMAILYAINDSNRAFDFDATDCPDLIPILSIYAGHCSGTSRISGLNRLSYKESNRIISTADMLSQLGIQHTVLEDTLEVTGGNPYRSCTVDSYNDHRIVMAASIAAMNADGPVTILNADAVSKSYPEFFGTLAETGIQCEFLK